MSYFRTTSVTVDNTSPLIFVYDDAATTPVPVSLDQTIETSSVVEVINFPELAYGSGTISSQTQRVVLPDILKGSAASNLIATPYNAVNITSNSALTDQNFVAVNFGTSLLYDQLVIETVIVHNGISPGASRTITVKCRFSSEVITSGNVAELTTTTPEYNLFWTRTASASITRRFINIAVPYLQYGYFTFDWSGSDVGSAFTVTTRIFGRWAQNPWQ